jgi:hypothetical protein
VINDVCKLNKLKKSFVFRAEQTTHTNPDNKMGLLEILASWCGITWDCCELNTKCCVTTMPYTRNNMNKQEVVGRTNRLLSLIRHGPY